MKYKEERAWIGLSKATDIMAYVAIVLMVCTLVMILFSPTSTGTTIAKIKKAYDIELNKK